MHATFFKTARKGFTLIELMVVVAIIGILAAMAMSLYTGATAKARNARLKGNVKAYQSAMEQTYDATDGTYTAVTGSNFATGVLPTETSINISSAGTSYCISSDALQTTADTNHGANCAGVGAANSGLCNWTGTTKYCVKNLQ